MNYFKTITLFAFLITLSGCSDKKLFSETSCSIDLVNDSGELIVTTKGDAVLKVAGWAVDNLSKQAPDTIEINLVSSGGVVTGFMEGKLTIPRPDVNIALNVPSISNAGFGLSAQLHSLAPGLYEIQILQHFIDRILVCKSAKRINVE